jgi:hypothetical protein
VRSRAASRDAAGVDYISNGSTEREEPHPATASMSTPSGQRPPFPLPGCSAAIILLSGTPVEGLRWSFEVPIREAKRQEIMRTFTKYSHCLRDSPRGKKGISECERR